MRLLCLAALSLASFFLGVLTGSVATTRLFDRVLANVSEVDRKRFFSRVERRVAEKA